MCSEKLVNMLAFSLFRKFKEHLEFLYLLCRALGRNRIVGELG